MNRLILISLLSLLLLSSCASPDFVIGALNCSIISEDYTSAIHYFGTPTDGYINEKGDGALKWHRNKSTTVITQNPINVSTKSSFQINSSALSPDTIKMTTTTKVSGGEISSFERIDSCTLFLFIRDRKVESYSYFHNGFDSLLLSDNSGNWQSTLFYLAKRGELKALAKKLVVIPEYVADKDNLIRLAIHACRHNKNWVAAYLVQTYNLDTEKKVRTFIDNGKSGRYMDSRKGGYGSFEGHAEVLSIQDVAQNVDKLRTMKPQESIVNKSINALPYLLLGGIVGIYVYQQQQEY